MMMKDREKRNRGRKTELKDAGLGTINQAVLPVAGNEIGKQQLRGRLSSDGSTRHCFHVNAKETVTQKNSAFDQAASKKVPKKSKSSDTRNSIDYGGLDVSDGTTTTGTYPSSQQDQIKYFSDIAQKGSPGTASENPSAESESFRPPLSPYVDVKLSKKSKRKNATVTGTVKIVDDDDDVDDRDDEHDRDEPVPLESTVPLTWLEWICHIFDPTDILMSDVKYFPDGTPYFDENSFTIASVLRCFFYDPLQPEFTSLQQFNWAVIIGIVMGLYTAFWKWYIEFGVHLFWKTIPNQLYEWGIFTDLDGVFPLYHYVWICPMIFGAILSYIFVVLPNQVPGQDAWITNVHTKGVQDHRAFFSCFQLATASMWSGLSLGPELPLVLTGGMFGSFFGVLTKQSLLQARVLNLTAASAAVGGFFGFPMAGALFVLEIPHRMGLQYFEALSPGTIATIMAVLTNSLLTGSEVRGYFKFPFLTSSLPSWLFLDSIVYGFYGALIGIFYVTVIKSLKQKVQYMFAPYVPTAPKLNHSEKNQNGESKPLLAGKPTASELKPSGNVQSMVSCFVIKSKPIRATVIGAIIGATVGVIGMFLPHTMFWGEEQLQNLIDKGRTPLPVFSVDPDEPISAFTKFAMCMVDPNDPMSVEKGFGIECASLLIVVKTIVIGLCVGTGIVGGQFWGPLYVGCAAAHLLSDTCAWLEINFHFGGRIAAFPCIAMLCTMGGAHVVMFRSHMGILLILTLTISAFNSGDDQISQLGLAGDYSAIFPLLVVSVFISLMASRNTVMYPAQRSRGDITAVPEVLCQPNMTGAPVVEQYQFSDIDDSYEDDSDDEYYEEDYDDEEGGERYPTENFRENDRIKTTGNQFPTEHSSYGQQSSRLDVVSGVPIHDHVQVESNAATTRGDMKKLSHRRSNSLPMPEAPPAPPSQPPVPSQTDVQIHSGQRTASQSPTVRASKHVSGNSPRFVRVVSFGEVDEPQPSLLDQARTRSASGAGDSVHRNQHRRVPSLPLPPIASDVSSSTNNNNNNSARVPSGSSSMWKGSPRNPRSHSRKTSKGSDAGGSANDGNVFFK